MEPNLWDMLRVKRRIRARVATAHMHIVAHCLKWRETGDVERQGINIVILHEILGF
jgi:hypothetical protein